MLLCSSIIFALQHNPDFTEHGEAFQAGVIFGLLYEYCGLTASVAAHAMSNIFVEIGNICKTFSWYVKDKISQIDALKQSYKDSPTETEGYRWSNGLDIKTRDKFKLITQNRILSQLVDELLNEANNSKNEINDYDKSIQHLLEENSNLRKRAMNKISKGYIFKMFYREENEIDNSSTDIENDVDKVKLYSYLTV